MTQDLWYYSRDGEEKVGPTPGDHLRAWIGSGQLNGDTLVWRPGMEDWTPIENVLELRVSVPDPEPVRPASPKSPTSPVEKQGPTVIKLLFAALKAFKGFLTSKSLLKQVRGKVFTWAALKIIIFVVGIPYLLLDFLVVPGVASRAVDDWAERYGIQLAVEDWKADLFDLSATARNAMIRIPGPRYGSDEFVKADRIVVDLSLFGGLFDKQWVQEVRLEEPEIYLERQLSGHWNWQDLIRTPPTPKASDVSRASFRAQREQDSRKDGNGSAEDADSGGSTTFSLPSLSIEEMGLQWVENLPGGSRGGLIQELKTNLFIDDISIDLSDLVGPVDPGPERGSTMNLHARTGGGVISFTGEANFFYWKVSQEQADEVEWMPTVKGKIYLENISSNALARLIPDAPIMPEEGTMTGTIEFEVIEKEVTCFASLELRNVTFVANQASRFIEGNASEIDRQLSGLRENGHHQFSCGGRLGEGTYRPFQAFQTNVIRQGVRKADSTTVRALASIEHDRYSEDPVDSELDSEINRILSDTDPEWLKWVGLAVEADSRLRDSGRGLRRLRDRFKP